MARVPVPIIDLPDELPEEYEIDWDFEIKEKEHQAVLTERGIVLGRLFHECDLLVAEAIFDGVFDGIDDASVAGLASCFVYEHRSSGDPPLPWFPDQDVRQRAARPSTRTGPPR